MTTQIPDEIRYRGRLYAITAEALIGLPEISMALAVITQVAGGLILLTRDILRESSVTCSPN